MLRKLALVTALTLTNGLLYCGEFITVGAKGEFIASRQINAYFSCILNPENGKFESASVIFENLKEPPYIPCLMKPETAQIFARDLENAIGSRKNKFEHIEGNWKILYQHHQNRRSMILTYTAPFGSVQFPFDYNDLTTFIEYCRNAEETSKTWLFDLLGENSAGSSH